LNVLIGFAVGALFLWLGARFYGRFISRKMGLEPDRPTPATTMNDGQDYCPTNRHVVFAHHFSTIAGAGPIIGPTFAAIYGFVPVWLWIVLGGIFIGAVHDFVSVFASIRERGQSIAHITRKTLGKSGFVLFMSFAIIMIVLVTSAFLDLTARSLTSLWPVSALGLEPGQTLLRTVSVGGEQMGVIGGIASMSVIVITLLSPLIGYLLYKRGMGTMRAYLLAFVVYLVSVTIGFHSPVSISPLTWTIIISVYVFSVAGLPVWVVLQPRDFVNVQLLYAGLIMLVGGVIVAGFKGLTINMPSFNVAQGAEAIGLVWPMLFITIACGAISGFHSLVGSGTTSKQISREYDARTVGYNAMILESLLALCVAIAVSSALSHSDYLRITFPHILGSTDASNPVLAFSLSVGHLAQVAFGIPVAICSIIGILMVEGFVITTLDSAVRLTRYLFEELWSEIFTSVPQVLKAHWFNAALAVGLMFYLAYSRTVLKLWPVFGASNQLLAALTLMSASAWLYYRGKQIWYVAIPALIMIVTTIGAIWMLLEKHYNAGDGVLFVVDAILMGLALGIVVLTAKTLLAKARGRHNAPAQVTP